MEAVTACIPTRGDVDLTPILESLPRSWDVQVYDNSVEEDLAVYGRYAAIERAGTRIVYTQDDDCVLPPESLRALTEAYIPGVLTTNMPAPFREHYSDSSLIGFGAIFDRYLSGFAFSRLMPDLPPNFNIVCDVYFTALTEDQTWLDLDYRNLSWATADSRMYRQPNHVTERHAALEHARTLR